MVQNTPPPEDCILEVKHEHNFTAELESSYFTFQNVIFQIGHKNLERIDGLYIQHIFLK